MDEKLITGRGPDLPKRTGMQARVLRKNAAGQGRLRHGSMPENRRHE